MNMYKLIIRNLIRILKLNHFDSHKVHLPKYMSNYEEQRGER